MMLPMSISSVSSVSSVPAPVQTPDASGVKAPEVKADSDADEARAAASQPAVLAPLPPGQGMRIDQIA
jgi:hypothetical protein